MFAAFDDPESEPIGVRIGLGQRPAKPEKQELGCSGQRPGMPKSEPHPGFVRFHRHFPISQTEITSTSLQSSCDMRQMPCSLLQASHFRLHRCHPSAHIFCSPHFLPNCHTTLYSGLSTVLILCLSPHVLTHHHLVMKHRWLLPLEEPANWLLNSPSSSA